MPEALVERAIEQSFRVWRIAKARHAETHWDGIGNRLVDSRWVERGRSVVHTAGSLALAQLEILVHLPRHQAARHIEWVYASATLPAGIKVMQVDSGQLPEGWTTSRAMILRRLRAIGTRWHDGAMSPVLAVPSALSPAAGDTNYLLNPDHADFGRIQFNEPSPFEFDERLGSLLREKDRPQ